MVEIHGWITLRYSDYHGEFDKQAAFVQEFKQFIQQHCQWALDEDIGKLVDRNCMECYSIDVQHNHPGTPFYPLDIFTWVAQHSTGSYGMLYFMDDEDPQRYNEFQVYVLKRGKLTPAKDLFLSPYFEEVEKEYDSNDPPLD